MGPFNSRVRRHTMGKNAETNVVNRGASHEVPNLGMWEGP